MPATTRNALIPSKTVARILQTGALSLPILFGFPELTAAAEHRCGWFENPTPANYSLRDRDGTWVIGEQGGYRAAGLDRMPDMTKAGWVETNGHYGHGCACLTIGLDAGRKRITHVVSARPMPLARCRSDRSLPRP